MHSTLDEGLPGGISGVAQARDGLYWAVPERDRVLLAMRRDGGRLVVDRRIPLYGVPKGADTESVAFLGPGRVALGTEALGEGRPSDAVLLVEIGTATASVTGQIALPYGGWGLRAQTNRGVEGLCFAGGRLVAAAETVILVNGRRHAPVARWDPDTRKWTHFTLRLMSETGKVSALTCRPGAAGRIEVLAIERHFGVSVVVRFEVPVDGPGGRLEPTIVADVGPMFDETPNLESLERSGDDLVLIADNQSRTISGPAAVLIVPGGAAVAPATPKP